MPIDEQKLQTAIDKIEIMDCLARYCRGLDRQDPEMLLSAYHENAREQHGSFDGTPAEYVEYVMPFVSGAKVALHMITNVLIEVNGDKANCESYAYVIHNMDGDEEDHIVGRWIDRFEKRDGEWKIAHRLLTNDWSRRQPVATSPFAPLADFVPGRHSMQDAVYTASHVADLYA